MKIDDIKDIAQQHGVRTSKQKKTELIRAIQEAENNETCFAVGKKETCGQDACLWRRDCN